jgi:hypothetical protein
VSELCHLAGNRAAAQYHPGKIAMAIKEIAMAPSISQIQ